MREIGPSEVQRRRVSSCSHPLSPGSTIFNKVFLTAKPTPCSLRCSVLFPFQKKVQSFSFSLPESARRVSCKAAMSIFNRRSSSLMTAVFLTSLMFLRSSSPVVMVQTFQVPSLRAGLLLLLVLVLLLGAGCGLLVGCYLIPMHPMRKTDRGGTAPY